MKRPFTVISGGQTGVDRGALDAALERGIPCGGWCPRRRQAEDGRIPERYPVRELDGGYGARTLRNVLDSDGTLLIYFERLEGGTQQTLAHCLENRKPYQLVDASVVPPPAAGELVARFVAESGIRVLNVAGPRASKQPRARRYAREALLHTLDALRG